MYLIDLYSVDAPWAVLSPKLGSEKETCMARVVLVVDDEDLLLRAAARMIGKFLPDWEVLQAISATAALEVMAGRKPNLIVSDLQMADKNGWELIQELWKIHGKIPAILWSGNLKHNPPEMDEAAEMGVPCLPKPCETLTLRSIVRLLTNAPS